MFKISKEFLILFYDNLIVELSERILKNKILKRDFSLQMLGL